MIKVLFDLTIGQVFLKTTPHNGGTISAIPMLERLANEPSLCVSVVFWNDRDLNNDIQKIVKDKLLRTFYIYNDIDEINTILVKNEFDVFFVPAAASSHFFINKSNAKHIGFIHDLNPLDFNVLKVPYLYRYSSFRYAIRDIAQQIKHVIFPKIEHKKKKEIRKRYISLIQNLDNILTVSEYTQSALIREFSTSKDIPVLYSTMIDSFDISPEVKLEDFGLEREKYFMLVSANRKSKNNYFAIKVLDDFFSIEVESKMKVAVIGTQDYNNFKVKNADQFTFLPYVKRPFIELMYKNAFCFIYPTLFEGFGFPPLEAMKYGTPVICSAVTSLTQIYGESVMYFNPYDPKELLTRICQIYHNSDLRIQLVKRSRKQYQKIRTIQSQALEQLVSIIKTTASVS